MVEVEVARRPGGYVVVRVGGEVDISARPPLAEALGLAVDDYDAAVVIDLSAVRFFSAAGVQCVDMAVDALGARGRAVRVVCADPSPVWRVVSLLGLQAQWPVHHEMSRAVASLGPRRR
jgi:anti-anti-sigma factor